MRCESDSFFICTAANKESRERSAGTIYGSTLKRLVDVGKHAGFAAAVLTPTDSWTPYSEAPPLTYNPYPDYNKMPWNITNKGKYVECEGPSGRIRDLLVFSGHPENFGHTPVGSYVPLEIDSNLCFERQFRLGPYGFVEDEASSFDTSDKHEKINWDAANWGQLQDYCYARNADRYVPLEEMPHISKSPSTSPKVRRQHLNRTIKDDAEARRQGMHSLQMVKLKPKSRTALLLRSWTGKNYTENDKQNIRSLVTELSLRSGGEYQVYLLVQVKQKLPLWTDSAVYDKVLHDNIPIEFQDMTILWDDAKMKEWYPLIPSEINNVHQSQWLSVQKFAQEHPQFDYVWNWELDSRYTGHHYNLLERLAIFAKKQPRKGLWERNERYYIPSLHPIFTKRALLQHQIPDDS